MGSTPKRTFDVHKGLLCYHSEDFFDRLDDAMPQAPTGRYALRDEDPTVFAHFFIWMYTGKLMDEQFEEAPDAVTWELLVDTYLFAYRRQARRFRNACIDALIRKMIITDELTPPPLIVKVWYKIPVPMDPMRRLFVEFFKRSNAKLRNLGTAAVMAYPKELLARVALGGSIEEIPGLWEIRCAFHYHVEGEGYCLESGRALDIIRRETSALWSNTGL